MSDFLNTIRATTEKRIIALDIRALHQEAITARIPHDFLAALSKPTFPIIAEIKFASPSQGILQPNINPLKIADEYLQNGATALSVLTEPDFFKGNMLYLKQIRDAFPKACLLMKDFILSEQQLLQARIYGADAILLIVAFLSPQQLTFLYNKAIELKLTPLIEVHTAPELEIALTLNPSLIGINNRNLHTLEIDLNHSLTLIQHIPKGIFCISESGIRTAEELIHFKKLGFKGFLIGSHFMQTNHPGKALKDLLSAAEKTR
jgi:indole-3-glycerol phosphate synthase